MDKNEKEIYEFIKSNVVLPDIINEKINFAFEEIKNERKERNMKSKKLMSKVAIIIVAIFLCGNTVSLAFGGPNIYTMIYEYFNVPEEDKVNEIMLEGIKEDVDYVGLKSSIGYTIQYDKEDLILTREGEKDFYRVKNIEDIRKIEGLEKADVYFSVEYLETSYEELEEQNKENIDEEFEINGKKAFIVNSSNENYSWNADVKQLWYIDAIKGTYLIEQHYWMEATEGWGSRMSQMIQTIEIITVEQ